MCAKNYIYFFFITSFFISKGLSQTNSISDTKQLFIEFEKCITHYISDNNEIISDSIFIINDNQYLYLEESNLYDGNEYITKPVSFDTVYNEDSVFFVFIKHNYKSLFVDQFLLESYKKCNKQHELIKKPQFISSINVSSESWIQFFIDQIFNLKRSKIHVTIEIFDIQNNIFSYKRDLLILAYNKSVGFEIIKNINLQNKLCE